MFSKGLVGDARMHGWHCDCDTCCDDEYPFRLQSDSTADGEVISRIFTMRDMPLLKDLERAAVEADAEPDLRAGVHVHVGGLPTATVSRQRDAFRAFVWWERTLSKVAAGRWANQRDMNRNVYRDLSEYWTIDCGRHDDGRPDYVPVPWEGDYSGFDPGFVDGLGPARSKRAWDWLRVRHYDHDRHSNLNLRTSSGETWEFRLWNATRSAWRMEMYVLTSLLFADRTAVNALLERKPAFYNEPDLPGLVEVVKSIEGQDRLAELLARQAEYLDTRVFDAQFLALTA